MCVSCIAGEFFTTEPLGKPMISLCSTKMKVGFECVELHNLVQGFALAVAVMVAVVATFLLEEATETEP